ncbi:putative disease resistance RPP13-like protein 1 [Chenopodium quinoa]|uniref:Uncharacterized protein n=1 Tax=Chenopodium quinoa TaxID=63459 RepID=A0A803LZW2_CHEQI|nr:putative disease resistance RPP13-like protein 1 [Chenopodium quinoa]
MALEFVCGVFASVVVQELVDTIKSFGYDQFQHVIADVEKKLQALDMSYVKAQLMLDKVDGWELVSSKPHQDWVGEVRRACYDIEDLITDVMSEMRKAQNSLSFLKNWPRNMLEKEPLLDSRPFLREAVKEEIIKTLLLSTNFRRNGAAAAASSSNKGGSGTAGVIVLIEGMFGLGKTTLARVIDDDNKIETSFNQKFWVKLSGNFNLSKVLSSMVIQADSEQNQRQQSGLLHRDVSDRCRGRRVFIVLDDLCNFPNLQDWEEFEALLLNSTQMFGILITTRNPKVTHYVSSISMVPKLLSASVVDIHSKRKRCTLEESALEIAEKFCKGLPLVANVIRPHLYNEPEEQWSNMLSKDLWEMPLFREQIFPAFRLNFSDLSRGLKNCFCYLSLFPNGFNFKKKDLLQYWMAEGFIIQGHPGEPYHTAGWEETGNHLFDELLSRSIIVYDHESQVYKMHEFIHRYAQYVSSDIYLRLDKQFLNAYSSLSIGMPFISPTWYRKARHVSFVFRKFPPSVLKELEKCKGVRTIVTLLERTEIKELGYGLFSKLQSLRVLNLSATYISELPGSIGNLKHLRLLDVSRTDIESLPVSISKLTELQVLRLTKCYILELPKDTKNSTNLVHLEVDIKRLSCMPAHIGKLTKLQTLPAYIVGTKDGCQITELNKLKQIQGSLCLTNLEDVTGEDDAKKAMLSNKRFIKRLELEWSNNMKNPLQAKGVLKGLEPHQDLEELNIIGYGGDKFPNWLSEPECRLTSIHLERCHRCKSLPPLGQLPYLKALHLQEMCSIKCINDQFLGAGAASSFPALELLILEDMTSLEKWEGRLLMPRLHDLRILSCPVLHALPSLNQLAALVNLEIRECAALQSLPGGIMPLSLKQLIIEDSDLLAQRCLPEAGDDWCKINLVPSVVIDFLPIETLTSYTIQ